MRDQQVERHAVCISNALKQESFLIRLERESFGNILGGIDNGFGYDADFHIDSRFPHPGVVALQDIERFDDLLG